MKFAVRTSKIDVVKMHFLSSLMLEETDIATYPTMHRGITLLTLDETVVATLRSIRNIEALLLDEETASLLLLPTNASEAAIFKSLDGIDEREQYELLSHLLHIQKAKGSKGEIFRN